MTTPVNERRNRRIGLPRLRWARLAVAALVVAAVGVPAAWASRDRIDVGTSSPQPVFAPSPVYLNETVGEFGPVDIDQSPVLCQTTSFTPASASSARMDSWVTAGPGAGPIAFLVSNAISTDAGTTWQSVDSVASVGSSHGISGGYIDQGYAGNSAIVALTPGSTYVFGVRLARGNGEADPPGGRCEVLVEITQDPGEPGTPPIGIPGSPPGSRMSSEGR